MEVTAKSRLHIRIQNIIFLLLFLSLISLLAYLSQRYYFEADLTAANRNTLSDATIKLLQRMPETIKITTYARDSNLVPTRKNIDEFIKRYKKHKADIQINFINPDLEPDKTRAAGITVDGELVVSYNNRTEHVTNLREEALTNTLQRLMRSGEKKIVFISGHGERKPHGNANHDYATFVKHLKEKGIIASTLKLSNTPTIPDDTAVLVIAGAQLDYLPGEIKILKQYLAEGGNLLWLHEPGPLFGLSEIASELGITFQPGTIVDPTTQLLSINDPSFALVASYGQHPITRNFDFMTVFPRAAGIRYDAEKARESAAFLQTVSRSWSETDILQGVVEYSEGKDIPGPLTIGLALTRQPPENKTQSPQPESSQDNKPEQRIVVMGDGDFITNAYLGNQGNQDLGYNIINWLSHDDEFISIPVAMAPDTELVLDEITWGILGLFFLLAAPLLLLGSGIYIWLKRRKQ